MAVSIGVPYSQAHEVKNTSNRFSLKQNQFKYSGYYEDQESSTYYLKARYYSPELMRFINRDTYDLNNRYAYGDSNPINKEDPSGHSAHEWYIALGMGLLPGYNLYMIGEGIFNKNIPEFVMGCVGSVIEIYAGAGIYAKMRPMKNYKTQEDIFESSANNIMIQEKANLDKSRMFDEVNPFEPSKQYITKETDDLKNIMQELEDNRYKVPDSIFELVKNGPETLEEWYALHWTMRELPRLDNVKNYQLAVQYYIEKASKNICAGGYLYNYIEYNLKQEINRSLTKLKRCLDGFANHERLKKLYFEKILNTNNI